MPGERRTPATATFDAATREAAIRRAAEVGDQQAAAEIGCKAATIRSWRLRAKPTPSSPGPSTTPPQSAPSDDPGRAEMLRERAEQARAAELRAVDKADSLLANGRANDARAASAVARDANDRAARLEADARLQREHDLRARTAERELGDDRTRLIGEIVRLWAESAGIGWGAPHSDLLDALGRAVKVAGRGERGRLTVEPPEPEAQRARDAIRLILDRRERREQTDTEARSPTTADEIRDEINSDPAGLLDRLLAEVDAESPATLDPHEFRDPEPTPTGATGPRNFVAVSGVSADVAGGDLPAWDDLPEAWKQRYQIRRDLGRYEYAQHLRRERRRELERGAGPSFVERHPSFSHPGFTGAGGVL